jgi:hypothetical protein
MKIKLPENKNEITLEQYIKYVSIYQSYESDEIDVYTFNRRVLEIFTPLTYNQTSKVTQVDFEFCLEQITKALNEQVGFKPTFKIEDVEFGFIPNINNISTQEAHFLEALETMNIGEFIDASNTANKTEDLHKLMTVLFRPIINKDTFGNYEIAEYNGSKEYKDVVLKMPLSVVDGALFFFINLSTELQNFIQKSMEEEQKRAK